MRVFIRCLVILFSFGLSQAWAFEGFDHLWKAEDIVQDPETTKIRAQINHEMSELKKLEPSYQRVRDDVKALLPNLIGAMDGKGPGRKLSGEDIDFLCQDIKKELLQPARCHAFLKHFASKDKETIVMALEQKEEAFREIFPKYRAIQKRVQSLTEELQSKRSQ